MRKLIFALAFGLLMQPNYGFALGMGDIEVNSALNQQLDARIEVLSASAEDAETLIIKLASREEFARAGLDRPYELSSLKFTSLIESNKVYIRVTSPKPIREPFLNFLVEVDWPRGHLLREYTILLDPPVFMGTVNTGPAATAPQDSFRPDINRAAPRPAPVQVAAPVSAPVFAPAPVSPPPVAVTQSQVQAPRATQQAIPYSPPPVYAAPAVVEKPSEHRIQKGETAWHLAMKLRPDESISTGQMMLAMLRSNPEIFINGNVNGIRRGMILRVPDYEDITSISKSDAAAEISRQGGLWKEYQQAMSRDVPATGVIERSESSDVAARSSDAVSDVAKSPARPDGARLEIVSAGKGDSAAGEGKDPTEMSATELREHLSLVRERLETERLEKEELMGQISSLESQVNEMKNLMTIEDKSLTDVQSLGMTDKEKTDSAEMAAEEMAAEPETEAAELSEEDAMKALEKLAEATSTEQAETDETGMEEVVAEESLIEDEAVFVEAEESAGEVAPQEVSMEGYDEASDYIPEQPKSLIETLLNNKLVVGAVSLGGLIIAGLGYLLFKRRRGSAGQEAEAGLAEDLGIDFEKSSMDDDLESVADMVADEDIVNLSDDDEPEAADDAKVEADEESSDDESTVVLPSEEVAEAGDDKARDDVIAEADVYLAYGIYQQAEDLLNNAITENPDNEAYRLKLAETHFVGKNASGLEKAAVAMKEKVGDTDSSAWLKVLTMGKELCPDAAVFKDSAAVPDLDIDDLMPSSPEPVDLDLGNDDTVDTTDLDLDFSEALDDDISLDDAGLGALDESAVDELEFDIGDTEAIAEGTEVAAEVEADVDLSEEFSLDIDASELDIEADAAEKAEEISTDFDLDLSGELDSAELTADESLDDMAEETLDDLTIDELDISVDTEELVSDVVEDTADDFDLDLSAELDEELVSTGDDDELDLSSLGDVDEISTKLDLARAYLDMGDSDGAREIIDEVMIDGNDEQKKDAEVLLKEMS